MVIDVHDTLFAPLPDLHAALTACSANVLVLGAVATTSVDLVRALRVPRAAA
jgi:hypothetical protein